MGVHTYRALIDSGAATSVCHPSVYENTPKHLRSKLKPRPDCTLYAVNGAKLGCLGECTLRFRIGSSICRHKFLVTPDSQHMVLLGYDFLKEHKADLLASTNPRTLVLNGEHVSLESQAYMSSLVRLKKKVLLKPYTTIIAPGKPNKALTAGLQSESTFILSRVNTNFLADEPCIHMPEVAVTVKPGKDVPVLMFNNSGRHFKLRKGTVIGTLQSVGNQQVLEVNLLKPSSEVLELVNKSINATTTAKQTAENLEAYTGNPDKVTKVRESVLDSSQPPSNLPSVVPDEDADVPPQVNEQFRKEIHRL